MTTDGRGGSRATGRGVDRASLFFAVLAAASCLALALRDGWSAIAQALAADLALLLRILPVIVPALVIAGCLQVLVPREKVTRLLGAASGLRGLLLASAAGVLTPGGPFAAFPLVVALFAAGADVGATVAFLTAWSVIAVQRLVVWEIPLLGTEFALLRYAVSLPLPLLAGLLARALARRIVVPRPEQPTRGT
jgi:uncharacterized membrane protein YraQ (UPF0718 family)